MELTKQEIEKIIDYEIVVDCYSDEEANLGWAIYMEENIYYPFEAEYGVKKKNQKKVWKKVTVIDNETDESNFNGGDFYVEIELHDLVISTKLLGLRNINAGIETLKAIQVWKHRNSY